jgi:hypothetical protein
MHEGLKCVACVLRSLRGKNMNEESVLQDGVNAAKQAVTIWKGEALCTGHLFERILEMTFEEIHRAILSDGKR